MLQSHGWKEIQISRTSMFFGVIVALLLLVTMDGALWSNVACAQEEGSVAVQGQSDPNNGISTPQSEEMQIAILEAQLDEIR